jgi:uncharacterized protein
MTDSGLQEETEDDASSRRARLEHRRRKRMRIVAIAVFSLVILCAVAVAGLAYYDDGPQAEATANEPAIVPPTRAGLPTIAPGTDEPRALTHAAPLRLWVGGDSLAGSFGPALGDSVGATGVVDTTIDYKVSSGLWGDDVRNWSERATEQMTAEDPEVVVFMIGTNDTSAVNGVDSDNDGIDDWSVGYRERVGRMMDTLVGTTNRTVYWLGPPTLGRETMDDAAVKLGALMKEEAAKRGPNVAYVDTYELFKSDDGGYSRTVIDENGEAITARIQDGVHFTSAGAEYLARALFMLLDAKFRISSQADITQPIGWSFADGTSGEDIPGQSSRPRSRYRSGGSSRTTPVTDSPATTPVTAPPQTTPPTVPATSPPTSPPVTDPPTPTT